MNFNEEIEKELKELNLGGRCVSIPDEDKGATQDYLDIEEKLLLKDIETTRMVRESSRNVRLGLACSGSIVEQAVQMRHELTQTNYGIEELQRLFLHTPVADSFIRDNPSKCDTGSVQVELRRNLKKQ